MPMIKYKTTMSCLVVATPNFNAIKCFSVKTDLKSFLILLRDAFPSMYTNFKEEIETRYGK